MLELRFVQDLKPFRKIKPRALCNVQELDRKRTNGPQVDGIMGMALERTESLMHIENTVAILISCNTQNFILIYQFCNLFVKFYH